MQFNYQNLTANPEVFVEFGITVPGNTTVDFFASPYFLTWGQLLDSPELEDAISNGRGIVTDENNEVIAYSNYSTIIAALRQLVVDFPILQGTVQQLIQQVTDVETTNLLQDQVIALLQTGLTQITTIDLPALQADNAQNQIDIAALQNSLTTIQSDLTNLQNSVAQAQADATQALAENTLQDAAIAAESATNAQQDSDIAALQLAVASLTGSGMYVNVDNVPVSPIVSVAPTAGTAYTQNADFGAGGNVELELTFAISGQQLNRYPTTFTLSVNNVIIASEQLRLKSDFISDANSEDVRFFQRFSAPSGIVPVQITFVNQKVGWEVKLHRTQGKITKV